MHIVTRNVNTALSTMMEAATDSLYGAETVKNSSRNGAVWKFRRPVTLTYERPRERVLFHPVRDANPFFHVFEAVWMLAGRNDLAPVEFYVKRMREFSDNDHTLNGAYGYRWRRAKVGTGIPGNASYGGTTPDHRDEVDQLDILINLLRRSPDTRRTVLAMWNVEDDLCASVEPASKDVCCNLAAAFSLEPCWTCGGTGFFSEARALEIERSRPEWDRREVERKLCGISCLECDGPTGPFAGRRLDLTVFNRSNDVLWGMLGANAVHFSFLLEYVAGALGVPVGEYHQVSSNAHFYVERLDWKPEQMKGIHGHESTTVGPPLLKTPADRAAFDREAPLFVDEHGRPLSPLADAPFHRTYWENEWLSTVAEPLMRAYRCHKAGYADAAREWAGRVCDPNWARAANEWLSRRAKP